MITENENRLIEKKRVLNKIRPHFRRKKPEEDEEETFIVVPKFLDPNAIHIIDSSTGLVEKHRKILLGSQFLNLSIHIDSMTVTEQYGAKTITLNMGKPDQSVLVPWEYSVIRLESYGDLELATWACKIRNYNLNYPRELRKYCEKLQAGDQRTIESMGGIKLKAQQKMREIEEGKYPYRKICYRCGTEGTSLVSITFNEAILKEVGQNIQSFTIGVGQGGIPALFKDDSKYIVGTGQGYFGYSENWLSSPNCSLIGESPEIKNMICDASGNKREVITQYIRISEPTSYGFFHTSYIVIKNDDTFEDKFQQKNSDQSGSIDGHAHKRMKILMGNEEYIE